MGGSRVGLGGQGDEDVQVEFLTLCFVTVYWINQSFAVTQKPSACSR